MHQAPTDETLFRTGSLRRMPQLWQELGGGRRAAADADDPCTRLRGIERPALAPIRLAGELLQAGAHATGHDDFGLRLGARHHSGDLGTLGFLLLSAPDVEAMLDTVSRHGRLIQSHAFDTVIESGSLELYYHAPIADGEQRRQDAEFSLACMVAAVRHAVGSRLAPAEVAFEHAAPASPAQHLAWFGCPVRFNRPANRVVLGCAVRNTPVVTADATLFARLGDYIESGFGAQLDRRELVRIVGSLIASLLPGGEASLDAVARRLDLSSRSLQRRLAEAGAGFGELLDAARRELARHYVLDTRLSMSDIAQRLGYAESAVFTRSYRRWHQLSPRQHRRVHAN